MQTSEALIELRKGLRVFKAFEHAESLATFVEGLEQNKRELEAAILKLRVDLESSKSTHDADLADLVAKKAEAEADARAAKDAAKLAGQDEMLAAKRKAKSTLEQAAAGVEAAQARQAEAERAAREAEGRVDAANDTLKQLTFKIDSAKAQIAKLLGQ